MNIYLNETILKVFPNGEIWIFGLKGRNSKEQTWHFLKGSIRTSKNGYKQHCTNINQKIYVTSRVIAYAYLRFDLEETEDTIDHINRNSLDNHISNLRCASRQEQALNRRYLNAKGWHLKGGRYVTSIKINCKTKYLGTYDTQEEANTAYLRAVSLRT